MTHALMFAAATLLLLGLAAAGLALFTRYIAHKAELSVPPGGRMVTVAGGVLHVHQQGAGPAILMIHGLGGQLQHYTYGVAAQLGGKYRVVVPDRPGSGYSPRAPGAAADVSAQAAVLAALIAKLRLGPALVVGHSLGGAVALTLALEHPQHVAGLALIAPVSHLPDQVPTAFTALTIRARLLRTLFAWTLATPGTLARSRTLLGQVFGPEPAPEDFPIRGGGLLSLRPCQFLSACNDLQALPQRLPQLESRYGQLRVPLSVLYGRDDQILDWKANGQALVDQVPGASLKLVDGGHMLPLTQPALTAAFIREAAAAAFAGERSAACQ
jgi:pimeloyl-ACP methyl ester carboxylesterase